MVWSLTPTVPGGQTYYIFSKGTYLVGRKDGDIVLQDKAVSRIHAEIVVDKMKTGDPSPSYVRLVNKSTKGTTIKRALGSRAVKLLPEGNSEAALDEGDLVTFGNVNFRFTFVPITFFIHSSNVDQSTQASISSIGARTSCKWSPDCSHILVDQSSPVSLDLIEAIIAKKPVVLVDWVKILAVSNICSEFPSYIPYIPTLTLEGMSIKIMDPNSHTKCLEGFSFVLGASHKYIFGDKFQPLLDVGGAKFLDANEFCSDSQTSADGENNYVLVVPEKLPNELKLSQDLSSLSRVTDLKLVAAVLSGQFDSSIIEPPSVIVSSSNSTDETIVADSEVEIDTATSDRVASDAKSHDASDHEHEDREAQFAEDKDARGDEYDFKASYLGHAASLKNYYLSSISSEKIKFPEDDDVRSVMKMNKGDESLADRHENSDIIYSEGLIVRNTTILRPDQSTTNKQVNFKCFRKKETVSGNSFKDLIPFSRDPYNESDSGSNRVDYMREEKKRKQLEAIAEDLFNNEKAKKRANAGSSLQALFGRR